MLNRDELKTIISTLQSILSKLDEFKPCLKCSRPRAARDLCSTHYSQWRREYCREHQIKKLRDQPKVTEPDPRQTALLFEDLSVLEKFEF